MTVKPFYVLFTNLLTVTALILFSFLNINAQSAFEKTFDYGFAETIFDMQQTIDNGFIMVGFQGIGIGASKILLIKTDSLGNEEWHKLLGGPLNQTGYAVRQTADLGFIITGNMSTDILTLYHHCSFV